MNARERIMASLRGEEPDKIPVCAWDTLRFGSQGGWKRRLRERGLGLIGLCSPYVPSLNTRSYNPWVENVKHTQINYIEKGTHKYRHVLETPVGSITGVVKINRVDVDLLAGSPEEHFVKEPDDWRIVNYIFKAVIDSLAPNYQAFERLEDEIGTSGVTFARVEKTPYQRAWVELASPERTVIDFNEQPDDFQEYLEIQKQLHTKIAEIVAESPADFINIVDHVTDMTSPSIYRKYCLPFYEMYSKALEGTGKILGSHMDGRFGHLKKEVAESPIKVPESLTVAPVGDLSLTEYREAWPDKILFINTTPHLALSEPEEVRKGYEALAEEWGSKKGLLIEHSEDMPLEKVEGHLSAALDVFGY